MTALYAAVYNPFFGILQQWQNLLLPPLHLCKYSENKDFMKLHCQETHNLTMIYHFILQIALTNPTNQNRGYASHIFCERFRHL